MQFSNIFRGFMTPSVSLPDPWLPISFGG